MRDYHHQNNRHQSRQSNRIPNTAAVVFEPRERCNRLWHLGAIDIIPLTSECVRCKLASHGCEPFHQQTIDTNRDRATEFPRQLWSSFCHMRDAIVHGILAISTAFLRPASECVGFERAVNVWEPHHHQYNRHKPRQSNRISGSL